HHAGWGAVAAPRRYDRPLRAALALLRLRDRSGDGLPVGGFQAGRHGRRARKARRLDAGAGSDDYGSAGLRLDSEELLWSWRFRGAAHRAEQHEYGREPDLLVVPESCIHADRGGRPGLERYNGDGRRRAADDRAEFPSGTVPLVSASSGRLSGGELLGHPYQLAFVLSR